MLDRILIRPAGLDDLPHILRHRRGMFRDMGTSDEAALDRMIAASEVFLRVSMPRCTYYSWLAELPEHSVVGGGSIQVSPWIPGINDPSPRRAYIHNLYTEPEFRHRGVGRRMMEVMVAWCRQEGFQFVALHAAEQARPLYERLGFHATNEMRLKLF